MDTPPPQKHLAYYSFWADDPRPNPDRHLTERSLFNAYVDASEDVFYDWHLRTGYADYSSHMWTLLGIPAEGASLPFESWIERLHADDRDTTLQRLQLSMDSGVYRDQYRMRRADGSYVAVSDHAVVIVDDDGTPSHMVGSIRDTTHELESQRAVHEAAELYWALFENTVNPAFRVARAGRFVDVNAAGAQFLETSRPRLLQLSVDAVWGMDALTAIQSVLASGVTSSIELEIELDVTKALSVTLVPCSFHGDVTCFALGTDITDHRNLRIALEESQTSLTQQAAALSDSNTALRVLLDQRNRDRAELERNFVENVETVVIPMLGHLAKPLARTPENIYLDAAMQALKDVVNPYAHMLEEATAFGSLTPREREIAHLIRSGRSTAEIAEALYISPSTVTFHRKNLRRKLGLSTGGPRLATHLTPAADEQRVPASALNSDETPYGTGRSCQ